LPTVVVEQGTLVLEDREAVSDSAILEIKDVSLTAVEDPPGIVTVSGGGRCDAAGPVHFGAVVRRATGDVNATADLLTVPVGPDLVQRLSAFCPDMAAQVRLLRGDGAIQASAAYHPAAE